MIFDLSERLLAVFTLEMRFDYPTGATSEVVAKFLKEDPAVQAFQRLHPLKLAHRISIVSAGAIGKLLRWPP